MNFRILTLFISLFVGCFTTKGQTKDTEFYRCAFFNSYRAGDMSGWPALIDEMVQVKSDNINWQMEILKAMYGLVGYHIGLGDQGTAKEYIFRADAYFGALLPKNSGNAQLHCLIGAFYGYKISLAVYKAPFLGPKSLEHIDRALKLDPAEPMGYVEKGHSLDYRPAVFGGDKKEAMKYYQKALSLWDAQPNATCNWQKMLLRATMLKTLYDTNQDKEAEAFLAAMQKDYGQLSWIRKFVGARYTENK